MNHRHLAIAALAVLTIQGCAVQPAAPTVAQDEFLDGQAKTCTASTPDLKTSPAATIAMTNDGWCGVSVADASGKPFQLALIGTRPQHGRVYTQKVNSRTRVEYTPFAGYTGADAFTVMLRPAGGGTEQALQVAVTVTPGAAPAVTEPEKTPAKTTPTRRTTTRRTTPAR